jgi:hypothetical protein
MANNAVLINSTSTYTKFYMIQYTIYSSEGSHIHNASVLAATKLKQYSQVTTWEYHNLQLPLCFDVYTSTEKKNVQKYEAKYQNMTHDCQ